VTQELAIDQLPGFRRRFRVTPLPGCVRAELEDDFHCMSVTLHHENGVMLAVAAEQDRAPWSTCPGAIPRLSRTFAGVRLELAAHRGDKKLNCTHLYDLVELAAVHARDTNFLVYDILVSDPVERRRQIELRRNAEPVMHWIETNGRFTAPTALAGLSLREMRDWIHSLEPERQEYARVLRWGAMVAHGRLVPAGRQYDARQLPQNCYTFQPDVAVNARRIGVAREFSRGSAYPLDRRSSAALGTERHS
jgi:hypothetical protein